MKLSKKQKAQGVHKVDDKIVSSYIDVRFQVTTNVENGQSTVSFETGAINLSSKNRGFPDLYFGGNNFKEQKKYVLSWLSDQFKLMSNINKDKV